MLLDGLHSWVQVILILGVVYLVGELVVLLFIVLLLEVLLLLLLHLLALSLRVSLLGDLLLLQGLSEVNGKLLSFLKGVVDLASQKRFRFVRGLFKGLRSEMPSVLLLLLLYSKLLMVLRSLMYLLCLLSLFLLLLLPITFSDVHGHLHSLQHGVNFIGGQ